MNVCSGVLCTNIAKENKGIKTIHYMRIKCGIFGNGYEKTVASLANVQYNYNVMFYTHLEAGFVSL